MATDLHPDVVAAISSLRGTRVYRRFNRFAQRHYGIEGWRLAGKQLAGEGGGTAASPNTSYAGAKGPGQFIPSTRKYMIQKYGIDPWHSNKEAVQALMLYDMERGGVAGYNPGMPSYTSYVLGQKLGASTRASLRGDGGFSPGAPASTDVTIGSRTIPGQSFAGERQDARRQLLLGGDLSMSRLLDYARKRDELQDVPSRRVMGDVRVNRNPGQQMSVTPGYGHPIKQAGEVYEVFYDPMGRYWDSGAVHKGSIGGHGDHVHVGGDTALVEAMGRYAQSLGLSVSGEKKFGGTPSSGHVSGSFHYTDNAIDVSGDPALMRKFARVAMREARRRRRR